MAVVERYVELYHARDWESLRECFDENDFVRTGPYLDVIADRSDYVAFLGRVVPSLGDEYELRVDRILYTADGRTAFAQLTERIPIDGKMTDIPEAIIFDLNDAGLIRRIRLYLQQPGGVAPAGGTDSMGDTTGSGGAGSS